MIVEKLIASLGADVVTPGAESEPRFHKDWTSKEPIVPLAVVLPRDTGQVSMAMHLCNEHGIPVVPQGGMTGLVGGARPRSDGIVINLSRLRAKPLINPLARTVTVSAGTTLQELQEAALESGFVFPVDFGARGTCQIGGAIATNAGGVHVMHYGMMRQQVLGLEAVLADGTVIDAMNGLLKNNTGYDLKQFFIGSEGTLGIVTRAVLRLIEKPAGRCVALVQVPGLPTAYQLLRAVDRALPGLAAFEAMWPSYYRYACQVEGSAPLPTNEQLTLLIEIQGPQPQADQARLLQVLEALMEKETVLDAAIAQSEAQCEKFWALRDANGELARCYKRLIGFDVSLPPETMGLFLDRCQAALLALSPDISQMCFGHLGDGNLHVVVCLDNAPNIDETTVKDRVLGLVGECHGSISAEHGIGLDKLAYLSISRNPAELELMRRLKSALDPRHILNPGKVLSEA